MFVPLYYVTANDLTTCRHDKNSISNLDKTIDLRIIFKRVTFFFLEIWEVIFKTLI
jgi:hypothetical protein